ncbi:MAG TPA: type II toxin-antitoxin system RelE/ParE family toxin [Gracilimonas sp.]|uniref:type II toxin-antitoxin system RelE/ParE family toxin n=1 Tax=Gracilimonas sp. TaxID=1974203 RepID=UPI002DA3865C|nr:type II toxin-antitoxin system RelE/ParE family toxin [Gracilimonas sp.]
MVERKRVVWSLESSDKIQEIKAYLLEEWSESEVNSFLIRLKKFENRVSYFPRLYPASLKFSHLRKAVISKHQSVVYEIGEDTVKVITILDNRQKN